MIFNRDKIYFYQKQVMIILFIAAICCGTQDTMVLVIQPFIQISLYQMIQINFAATFLLAQYALGYTVGTLIACAIVDKLGRVKGILYAGIGLVFSGFMYASVLTTEMLSLTHMFHGFNLGVFNLAIFILAYETLHIKKNQGMVIIFIGKALGTFAAVLIGQFVMKTLNGSWGICVAFASFLILILLPIIHIYVKEPPLYLLARDKNSEMNQFIDHVNDLEYNQIWHNIPARRAYDAKRVSYKQFLSDKFDPGSIGKFWMNIPQIFQFGFTGPLIYLWSVHQQNIQADDIYIYQKVQYYFYVLNLPFFTDLVWNLVSLGVAYAVIRQGRRLILVVTFTYSSIMLMYYMTLAYTNQQISNITSSNYYPSGQSGSSAAPQYPYAGNNNQYTGFPYYYFPYIQTGYPNYQLVWFDWTMFGLRIIEPALLIFTLENYPTHLRATALGLMLTFQALSKMMVGLTQALVFNISQIFYYSVLVFLMVVAAIVAFSMQHHTYDEYDDIQTGEMDYEMQNKTSELQDSMQEPLIFNNMGHQPIERRHEPPVQTNVQFNPSGILDARTIQRIKQLNEKYLNT